MMEKVPAPRPFIATMINGFLPDIFRVKLLSNPQKMQAANTPSAPRENPNPPEPFHDSRTLAIVTNPMAAKIRLLIASLNKITAIKVVATLSKFNNKDAVPAGVVFNPNRRIIGPSTPPARTAPNNQGMSCRVIFASDRILLSCALCTSSNNNAPKPLPRYKNAARGIGSISPSSSLANGALAPKRMAARMACIYGRVLLVFIVFIMLIPVDYIRAKPAVLFQPEAVTMSQPGNFGIRYNPSNL